MQGWLTALSLVPPANGLRWPNVKDYHPNKTTSEGPSFNTAFYMLLHILIFFSIYTLLNHLPFHTCLICIASFCVTVASVMVTLLLWLYCLLSGWSYTYLSIVQPWNKSNTRGKYSHLMCYHGFVLLFQLAPEYGNF